MAQIEGIQSRKAGELPCQTMNWSSLMHDCEKSVLIDFSLTVKAVTLIFISGRCSAISSTKQEKSDSIYNLVNN